MRSGSLPGKNGELATFVHIVWTECKDKGSEFTGMKTIKYFSLPILSLFDLNIRNLIVFSLLERLLCLGVDLESFFFSNN